jgi:hypothetical protein
VGSTGNVAWVFRRCASSLRVRGSSGGLSLRPGAWVFRRCASSLRVRGSSGGCLFGRVRGSSGGALLLSGYVGLPGAVSSAGCVGLPAAGFFSPGTWVFRGLSLRPGAWVFRRCASSLRVRGSSGGLSLRPGTWVFRLRSVFVHARRDRWCLWMVAAPFHGWENGRSVERDNRLRGEVSPRASYRIYPFILPARQRV